MQIRNVIFLSWFTISSICVTEALIGDAESWVPPEKLHFNKVHCVHTQIWQVLLLPCLGLPSPEILIELVFNYLWFQCVTKFETHCPGRILLAIIITQHGKFSCKRMMEISGRGPAGSGCSRASWRRWWWWRTASRCQLTQRRENYQDFPINWMPKERKSKVQRSLFRIRQWKCHLASTGNRKRCIFSHPGFQGRVCNFIQNLLRLSLAYRKIRSVVISHFQKNTRPSCQLYVM